MLVSRWLGRVGEARLRPLMPTGVAATRLGLIELFHRAVACGQD